MSIEVHVRIRPNVPNCVWSSAETVLYSTANPNARYVYNKVHAHNSSNHTIFRGIEAIVHAAFDGKNVTVMAYGQTGSGKTHSMIGVPEDAGIVPRTAKLLLELKRSCPGTVIQAHYTEIYNESVKDLLEPQRGELALHEAPDGGVTFDKKTVVVDTYEDFLSLQTLAERHRKYGVTNLNEHSSRSHIILTFEIFRPNRSGRSAINLVDLAGSECAARANTEGLSLREGGFINRSLLTLGNVVDAIVEKRPYVPYRDAKLTRMLRHCLGGSGITIIICCVNPSRDNFEQTVATLRFTQRAMKIKNDPVVVLNMPPLFTHQYSEGTRALVDDLMEVGNAEYQRGLRDTYVYCAGTVASVVTHFDSQVRDSLHGMANAQRLLIAHDHAMAIDQIGRLYNQLNEHHRQKLRNAELAESERKRKRDVVGELEHRRIKLARLEEELRDKTAAADTDLAGWEYQLHQARQRQISEFDRILAAERARRSRIVYEQWVCMERIASRFVPVIKTSTPAIADLLGEESITLSPSSKEAALRVLWRALSKARSELSDLEMAHEMVRDDLEAIRQTLQRGKGAMVSESPQPLSTGDAVAIDEFSGLSMEVVEEHIHRLEREERKLRARVKREVRRESLRRVRDSLCVSRSPGTHGRSPSSSTTYSSRNRPAMATVGRDNRPPMPDQRELRDFVPWNNEPYSQGSHTGSSEENTRHNRGIYSEDVQNALSVVDSLKMRLMHHQRDRARAINADAPRRTAYAASPSSDAVGEEHQSQRAGHVSSGENYGGKKREEINLAAKAKRLRRKDSESEPAETEGDDATILSVYKRQIGPQPVSSVPSSRRSNKENAAHDIRITSIRKHSVVGKSSETPLSDTNTHRERSPTPVGIAARRRLEQHQSGGQGTRPAVERALWQLHSNSHSPTPSKERSRSRCQRGM